MPTHRSGGLHDLELWVADLAAAERSWGWLLTRLGHRLEDRWTTGVSFRRGDAYVVLESGPDVVDATHQRTRPGANHVALWAGPRADVDAMVADAAEHGWSLLFADRHPYAGGPEHYAAYLEDGAGFEVELVADDAARRPRLVVLSGLPGTGKTTVGDAVASALRAAHVSIDVTEEALLACGLAADVATGMAAYEAARVSAEAALAAGTDVVVDAVNDSAPARDTWSRAADATGAELIHVVLHLADEEEHRRRLTGRRRPFSWVAEPTWSDVLTRRDAYLTWDRPYTTVDAGAPLDVVVTAVLAAVHR